jgi:hypothetical protein
MSIKKSLGDHFDFVMISFLEMDILDFMFEQGDALGAQAKTG